MKTRPTADRVKVSVFGILAANVTEAAVLDLFAGTGALGLEALSRGAKTAVLVDKSAESVKIIAENAKLTRLERQVSICREEVFQAIRRLENVGESFDLVFCDPPYNLGFAGKVLLALDAGKMLQPGGILVLEHSRHENLPDDLKRIVAYRSEFYGETVVSFFACREGV